MNAVKFNGRTFSGKTTQNGTKLYQDNGELFAYVVHNPRQGYFAVSAGIHNGKPFYMYSTTTEAENLLGLSGMGMSAQHDLILETFVNPALHSRVNT